VNSLHTVEVPRRADIVVVAHVSAIEHVEDPFLAPGSQKVGARDKYNPGSGQIEIIAILHYPPVRSEIILGFHTQMIRLTG
jgi:hypothetical protein